MPAPPPSAAHKTTKIKTMKQPKRADAAKLQNSLNRGESATVGEYKFIRRNGHQQWRVEHANGQCAHSPGSLVEAFFKCREKVQVLAGTRKNTFRSNAPIIKPA